MNTTDEGCRNRDCCSAGGEGPLGAGAHVVLLLFLVLIDRRDVVNEAVALLARSLVVVALVILLVLRMYQPM